MKQIVCIIAMLSATNEAHCASPKAKLSTAQQLSSRYGTYLYRINDTIEARKKSLNCSSELAEELVELGLLLERPVDQRHSDAFNHLSARIEEPFDTKLLNLRAEHIKLTGSFAVALRTTLVPVTVLAIHRL